VNTSTQTPTPFRGEGWGEGEKPPGTEEKQVESEYQVLTHLQENELTTQRNISQRTGLSLGAVNILLKKMARKGLIKIEKLNTRTMRYILTPQGIKEKTRLTYQFVRSSYRQILNITSAVETLLSQEKTKNSTNKVILYGPADEVEQILLGTLRGLNIKPLIVRPTENNFKPATGQLVLTWRYEDDQTLPAKSGAVNIMNLI
jgi:DNA-binding MarR family transcriptional regulator